MLKVGHPELPVQIHFSWFFFPFHRAYIYFFERIVRKLLGDPRFALPFWSWDVPEGMRLPLAFANASSPLYDPFRAPAAGGKRRASAVGDRRSGGRRLAVASGCRAANLRL
ncbi:hypothetical protein ABZP36_017790 [Zizania latifolia]